MEKGNNYINHEFKENPGIFFERMDDIQFEKSKWSVVVFWNTRKHRFAEHAVGNAIGLLERACKVEQWPKQCAAMQGLAT